MNQPRDPLLREEGRRCQRSQSRCGRGPLRRVACNEGAEKLPEDLRVHGAGIDDIGPVVRVADAEPAWAGLHAVALLGVAGERGPPDGSLEQAHAHCPHALTCQRKDANWSRRRRVVVGVRRSVNVYVFGRGFIAPSVLVTCIGGLGSI